MITNPFEVSLLRPDDWHIHLRDGPALTSTVPPVAERFARAIVMPNLNPPVTTVAAAQEYRHRILKALPPGQAFEPLMTIYLTDSTSADEIRRARQSGLVFGAKLYPAGATTHSDAGVTDLRRLDRVFEAMEREGLVLQIHGEVTDPTVDVFDREQVFIDRHLGTLMRQFPGLKIVFEHITTRQAAQFVEEAGPELGATITAHHLLYNRNAMFRGGIRPHFYCLPILKREEHRRALLAAATSGNEKFFLGTDSAPHAQSAKETACGCAGIYTAHAGIELYAEAFDAAGALDQLEGFASRHGPAFYGLPRNTSRITLRREAWTVPLRFSFGKNEVVALRAGERIAWRLVS